jgi:hypothetical protein
MGLPTFVKISSSGMPVIDIGAMRHSVTVLQSGPASPPVYDASGVSQNIWSAFATGVYAAIGGQAAGAGKGGADVIRDGEIVSQIPLSIAMWYMSGLQPRMRILSDNGSTYVIQSIENVLEQNAVLVLTCLGIGANE